MLGVGALILDGSRVLMVERGRPPLAGYWSLPGGVVEVGERLEEALIREVREETGLEVTVGPIATVFERIIPDSAGICEYHYVLIDFHCTPDGGELRAGDDASSVQWFEIASLDEMLVTEGTRNVIVACCGRPNTQPHVTRP